MRRVILLALLAAVLAPAASSLAQDEAAPSRRPGWWELQMVISGPTSEPTRQTRRMCTDAAFDKIDSPLGVNMRGNGCAPLSTSRTATGWTTWGACDTGQMKIRANGVVNGDLNDRYHADIVVEMDPPPDPKAAKVLIAIDARWLGECPAGRKPGDVETDGEGPTPRAP
ncbi:MAG TPA: DUF3617 family protein [Caulobacteraceae bacterium]|jgi:hypothetical protein